MPGEYTYECKYRKEQSLTSYSPYMPLHPRHQNECP